MKCCKTRVEEDKVYSLLNIFDVYVSLCYSEEMTSAFKYLEKEIKKLNKCVQDLYLTDFCDNKKCIENIKGSLLKNLYY